MSAWNYITPALMGLIGSTTVILHSRNLAFKPTPSETGEYKFRRGRYDIIIFAIGTVFFLSMIIISRIDTGSWRNAFYFLPFLILIGLGLLLAGKPEITVSGNQITVKDKNSEQHFRTEEIADFQPRRLRGGFILVLNNGEKVFINPNLRGMLFFLGLLAKSAPENVSQKITNYLYRLRGYKRTFAE